MSCSRRPRGRQAACPTNLDPISLSMPVLNGFDFQTKRPSLRCCEIHVESFQFVAAPLGNEHEVRYEEQTNEIFFLGGGGNFAFTFGRVVVFQIALKTTNLKRSWFAPTRMSDLHFNRRVRGNSRSGIVGQEREMGAAGRGGPPTGSRGPRAAMSRRSGRAAAAIGPCHSRD